MASLTLTHVGKIFANGATAVSDFSLDVADGEFVVLVGPSGSGKTTTLRLIAGLETLSSGSISIGGRVVDALPARARDVAMMFQHPALYPHLSVRRNLTFSEDLRSWPWSWRRQGATDAVQAERVAEAVSLLELEPLLERRPGQLSGGEQQRVALARAMVRRPAVHLLDEPLSHLDSRLRSALRRQLHLLHRRLFATIVYVTHDPVEALTLADRVVVLDHGRVQQVDRPLAVYRQPANRTTARFFGWPPMNFIDGALVKVGEGLGLQTPAGAIPLPGSVAAQQGQRVTLGIRPENVRFVSPAECAAEPSLVLPVEFIDALGGSSLATLRLDELAITGRTNDTMALTLGRNVRAVLDMDHTHWFDGDSGRRLGRPEG